MIQDKSIFKLSRSVALHYHVVPVGIQGDRIRLITDRALQHGAAREIEQLCGQSVVIEQTSTDQFTDAMKEIYGLGAAAVAEDESDPVESKIPEPEDRGAVRFVNELLREARERRASDIHIEPFQSGLMVRLRVDGLLTEISVPQDLHRHGHKVTSRIKVMAGIDPTTALEPREGRIRLKDQNLRVSILPVLRGEAVHLRFLTSVDALPSLGELGMSKDQQDLVYSSMGIRGGLIVACGPTGSGKSTTLHVLLREADISSSKIITVEDPVEYELDSAVQMEVGHRITFASALKAILRHDPDVILIGEMRDRESAQIAIQAALTGHLVLTSLHTDDEIQALSRLRQLEIPPGLLAASIRLIISQRLVRVICPACSGMIRSVDNGHCENCSGMGFLGRTGIFKMTMIQDDEREAIGAGASEATVRDLLERRGVASLEEVGAELVMRGITTTDEITRIMGTST